MFRLIVLFLINDSSVDSWNTFHDDVREHLFKRLHHEVHLVSARVIGLYVYFRDASAMSLSSAAILAIAPCSFRCLTVAPTARAIP